jgi:hypothetical protein
MHNGKNNLIGKLRYILYLKKIELTIAQFEI